MSEQDKKKEDLEKTKRYEVVDTKTKKGKKGDKKTNKKGKKKRKAKKVILIILLVLFLLFLIAAGILAGIIWGKIGGDINISREQLLVRTQNTTILDKDGNVIATVSGDENREWIDLDQMSKYIPQAFIAIEDARFESHHGVDIKRTLGATVTFILNGGESDYGGSTITQQLVKYITTDNEDSGVSGVIRKIKEMAKAYQIENMISKQQIIELYLNAIPMGGFGKEISGVQMAAKYYFDKNASDLSLAESTYLAGINHAPNLYNPFEDETEEEKAEKTEKIQVRTKTVLNKMKELGKITTEEYDAAIQELENGLAFKEGVVRTLETELSYHTVAAIDQIAEQLAEENGWDKKWAKKQLYGGGYTIYTTQQTWVQRIMEEEYKDDYYLEYAREEANEGGHTQSAMVIIDNSDGTVSAVVGGLGNDASSVGVNRALNPRQPGSAIKPIAVILPGLMNGVITSSTVYNDNPTTFEKGTYPIKNSTGYLGIDTITHGIERSSNVMAAKVMVELGPLESIKFMRKLGVSTLVTADESDDGYNDEGIATALGGLTQGISPLEMAAAYATIANNGVYRTPTFYTKVVDGNGNTVLEPEREETRVFSEQIAYVVQEILMNVVYGSRGTATYCSISGMDTAAKTGTTSDDFDRWVCGFTPYYSAATWYGYDYNEEVRWSGTNPAGLLWRNVMRPVHKDLESKRFTRPDGVVTATICRDSGKTATDSCTRKETAYFVRGTVPEACDGHTKVTICKETGKIATEFCKDTEEKIYLEKPEKERTNLWQTSAGNIYDKIEEVCDVHTKAMPVVVKVIGLKEADAKKKLSDLGLKVIVKHDEDEDEKDGVVLRQSIAAGKEVEEGTSITITVNKLSSNSGNSGSGSGGSGGTGNSQKPNNNTVGGNTEKPNTNTIGGNSQKPSSNTIDDETTEKPNGNNARGTNVTE